MEIYWAVCILAVWKSVADSRLWTRLTEHPSRAYSGEAFANLIVRLNFHLLECSVTDPCWDWAQDFMDGRQALCPMTYLPSLWGLFLPPVKCFQLGWFCLYFIYINFYIYFCLRKILLQCMCRDQKTAWGGLFSPFTMWILGLEVQSSGLVGKAFTFWAISPHSYPFDVSLCSSGWPGSHRDFTTTDSLPDSGVEVSATMPGLASF